MGKNVKRSTNIIDCNILACWLEWHHHRCDEGREDTIYRDCSTWKIFEIGSYLPTNATSLDLHWVGRGMHKDSWRSEGKINFHPHCTADDEDDDDGGFVLNFRII